MNLVILVVGIILCLFSIGLPIVWVIKPQTTSEVSMESCLRFVRL